MATELTRYLEENQPADRFTPYHEYSERSNSLNVFLREGRSYSERLTDHVTLFRDADSSELLGFRIKGIRGILADAPN